MTELLAIALIYFIASNIRNWWLKRRYKKLTEGWREQYYLSERQLQFANERVEALSAINKAMMRQEMGGEWPEIVE